MLKRVGNGHGYEARLFAPNASIDKHLSILKIAENTSEIVISWSIVIYWPRGARPKRLYPLGEIWCRSTVYGFDFVVLAQDTI